MPENHRPANLPPLSGKLESIALLAPSLPLNFLVHPDRRQQKPGGMEHCSESACFHRLHSLFWSLNEAQVAALLNDDEQAVLAEFNRMFEAQPWRPLADHPHISEPPNDDLEPLLPAGEKLLHVLESRSAELRRFEWLRRLWSF